MKKLIFLVIASVMLGGCHPHDRDVAIAAIAGVATGAIIGYAVTDSGDGADMSEEYVDGQAEEAAGEACAPWAMVPSVALEAGLAYGDYAGESSYDGQPGYGQAPVRPFRSDGARLHQPRYPRHGFSRRAPYAGRHFSRAGRSYAMPGRYMAGRGGRHFRSFMGSRSAGHGYRRR